MAQPALNIIIPLGGLGGRFSSDGYLLAKPLVRILGKEMILWVLDHLSLLPGDHCYVVYDPNFIPQHIFEELVVAKAEVRDKLTFVHLKGPTIGAAETVLAGLRAIPQEERSRPTMCLDGDGFYTFNALERFRKVCRTSGAVFSYVDKDPKPVFSYVQIEGAEFGANTITCIREKEKVSDYANTGTYCFRSGLQLESFCAEVVARVQGEESRRSELFTSAVIEAMLAAGEHFTMLLLHPGSFHSLGSPALIQAFVSTWQRALEKKRFCFDLENTLIMVKNGDYLSSTPISQNVAVLRRLYRQGHIIILQTSEQDAGGQSVSILQVLKELNIEFHEIHFSKPKADFYIDDRAVYSGLDLAKELGYYDLSGPSLSDLQCLDKEGASQVAPTEAPRSVSLVQVAKEEGDTFLNTATGLPVIQMRQIRTFFLFDIDGTMVGTDPLYLKVFTHMLEPMGYTVDLEFYRAMIHGRVDLEIFRSLMPAHYTDDQLHELSRHKDELFRKEVLAQGVVPMPGLLETLRFARKHHIPCAAISNAPRVSCEALLEALGVWPFLDHLIIGAECRRAKPHPDPYLVSMQRFGAEPHECIVFEDSRSGIQAGVAAGARLIIGIQSSLSDHILRRHGAHATVKDFLDFTPHFLLQVHSSALDLALNTMCIQKLNQAHLPVESIPTAFEMPGGYIARTLRLQLMYKKSVANVEHLPVNAVLKMESESLNDSVVETLKLYQREWSFYQKVKHMVPLRLPRLFCTVEGAAGGVKGLILEDLSLMPDASPLVLRPGLDSAKLVVEKMSQLHAHFWGECSQLTEVFKLTDFDMERVLQDKWPKFKQMWAHRLDPDSLAVGEFIVKKWSWLQKQLSQPPFTLLHGNPRTGNIFMLKGPGGTAMPAFIDWQCVCLGKGVVDVAYFCVDAFDAADQEEAEKALVSDYYQSLQLQGVFGYSLDQCWQDYKLALMFWPVFVSVWFGSQSVSEIVDSEFPSRIVPSTFGAIMRHKAVSLLPEFAAMDLSHRCNKALNAMGMAVAAVHLDAKALKGGYICETLRLEVEYVDADARDPQGKPLPTTLVLKMEMPHSNDHQVATDLHLYDREWHFYENLASLMPVRVPQYYATLMSEDGARREGVLMEDFCVPGAVLNPKLDEAGVMLTVQHCAQMHAKFWDHPDLQGKMGVMPHNGPWFNPSWREKVVGHWPSFRAKWSAVLSPEALDAGEKIIKNFQWVQDTISSKPHTFLHGDVKPPNMFMMWDSECGVPAFIDWQYIAVGKSCCDILFFLVEGYDIAMSRELEPRVKKVYYDHLVHYGVMNYSFEDLQRDWKLACMYFPIYVAMWFGTVPDEDLVDPMFPRRFVPRCFDCILRNKAADILPLSS